LFFCQKKRRGRGEDIGDYMPISLIHAFAEMIAKMIALRLSPHMNYLVSKRPKCFIKKRSILDNLRLLKRVQALE
jgi:hypothetical protein